MGSLGLLLGATLDFLVQVVELRTSAAVAKSIIAEPTKIAYYVPPPTETPTSLPTAAPTSTRRPTATSTNTPRPTSRPSRTPTSRPVTAARLSARVVAATATVTGVIQAIAPTVAPLAKEFSLLSVLSPPSDRPAEQQADLNLDLRGSAPVSATLALVDYTGDTDPAAPQLAGLFADDRGPSLSSAFQVYDWSWDCNCRGGLVGEPDVTLIGVGTTPGEALHVPAAGAEIGDGFQVLALYADDNQITLKYTRSDNVANGYTLHLESVAVDANLVTLYRQANSAGRGELPALRAGQAFGRAKSAEIRIAIRDCGTFMDPRSRKDWWRGH